MSGDAAGPGLHLTRRGACASLLLAGKTFIASYCISSVVRRLDDQEGVVVFVAVRARGWG